MAGLAETIFHPLIVPIGCGTGKRRKFIFDYILGRRNHGYKSVVLPGTFREYLLPLRSLLGEGFSGLLQGAVRYVPLPEESSISLERRIPTKTFFQRSPEYLVIVGEGGYWPGKRRPSILVPPGRLSPRQYRDSSRYTPSVEDRCQSLSHHKLAKETPI